METTDILYTVQMNSKESLTIMEMKNIMNKVYMHSMGSLFCANHQSERKRPIRPGSL